MFATTVCVLRITFNMEIKPRARLKSLNIQMCLLQQTLL